MSYYVILLPLLVSVVIACGDFYWRDYDGSIPGDAIPAGITADNQVVYIGHAYLHKFGILMGTINKGKREVTIPCYGVKRTNRRVQILCAQNHTQFYWAAVNSSNIGDFIKDKCPVVGGWDVKSTESGHKIGTLFTGRKRHRDDLIIGNIAAYVLERLGKPLMYYPYDGDELHTEEYDVLMYSKTPPENSISVNHIRSVDKIDLDLRSSFPQ